MANNTPPITMAACPASAAVLFIHDILTQEDSSIAHPLVWHSVEIYPWLIFL